MTACMCGKNTRLRVSRDHGRQGSIYARAVAEEKEVTRQYKTARVIGMGYQLKVCTRAERFSILASLHSLNATLAF